MIQIKEYEHLSFIKWAKNKTEKDIYYLNYNEIYKLEEEYMIKNNKKWGVKFFIKLYQDYITSIIINEIDESSILTSFCSRNTLTSFCIY